MMFQTERSHALNSSHVSRICVVSALIAALLALPPALQAQDELTGFDLQVKQIADSCRSEVVAELETLVQSNKINMAQLFDTFYIPIPKTNPQKFHTQYDKYTDEVLRFVLDKYLETNERFLFVVAVDRNGYLPTHNSRYSKPLTNNADFNTKNNRTKRIFNDRTGLAAARNTQPYLLQNYSRDTGEMLADLSVPIFIQGKHWGAIRIGYKR
jgi:methyl-accepting chemotaxis protein